MGDPVALRVQVASWVSLMIELAVLLRRYLRTRLNLRPYVDRLRKRLVDLERLRYLLPYVYGIIKSWEEAGVCLVLPDTCASTCASFTEVSWTPRLLARSRELCQLVEHSE